MPQTLHELAADGCNALKCIAPLASRLRQAGIVLLSCGESGEIVQRPTRGETWLADVLTVSPIFLQAVRSAAQQWSVQAEPEPIEAVPGLWLVPMPMVTRRRRVGYTLAVLATPTLLETEELRAVCQAAQFDFTLCCVMLTKLPPVAESDVPRLATMLRLAYEDHLRLVAGDQAMESVGRQLGESYEEMNLLYTIIQNMTVKERPDRFVLTACRELLTTLPYAWIGAQFSDEAPASERLKGLAGQLLTAGAAPETGATLRQTARDLLKIVQPDSAIVLEPATNPAHASFGALGGMALVQPLTSAGEIMGVLIAADKRGDDTAATSVDMKLLSATASHMAIFLENAALYDDLNTMFLGTVEALTASIDAKDRYTCGHSRRVALLTKQLAQAIGLDDHTVERMHIAGLVHDVGKIGVPEEVLLKPGKLTEAEFDWIRRHPEMGYRILKDIPQLTDILPGVLHHHERWDGRGYPAGLIGEDIPLVARLIALADSFDAMSSTRTYRSALSRPQVLEEIIRCGGTQFDAQLAHAFVKLDFSEFDRLVREHRAQEIRRSMREAAA